MRLTGFRRLLAALGMTVAVAVLAGAAAGCAAGAATSGPGGPPTPPTPAKTTAGTPRTLPTATCGRVTTHGLNPSTRVFSADKSALTCFQAAARACKAASIGVTEMGVDTGTNLVLAIEPGGKGCPVTDLSQNYSANFGGSTGKVAAMRCSVAAVSGAGVTLACGSQRLLIPATVSHP